MRSLLFLFVSLVFANNANAEIYISQKFSHIGKNLDMSVKPMSKAYQLIIPEKSRLEETKIDIGVNNAAFKGITALICSKTELDNLLAGRSYRCEQSKGHGMVSVSVKPESSQSYYMVLINNNVIRPKHITAKRTITFALDNQERKELKDKLAGLMQALHETFIFPDFDLSVQACGQKNAFSTIKEGNITICSEIYFAPSFGDKEGIVTGIILHELGHSLLNLWGLPNYDNERTADEFAVTMLLMGDRSDQAEDLAAYFEESLNTQMEAKVIEATQDMHPLNIQRVSAIKNILANPLPVIRRWNKVLYPHMTDKALNEVIAGNMGLGADADLAKQILAQRQREQEFQSINNKE